LAFEYFTGHLLVVGLDCIVFITFSL